MIAATKRSRQGLRASGAALLWALSGVFPASGIAYPQANPPESAGESQEAPPAILRWTPGDGLRLALGRFTARIRQRYHLDLVDPDFRELEEVIGETFEDRTDVRRARLLGDFGFREGSALEDWSLRAQVDFADSVINWLDLAVTYAGLRPIEDGAIARLRFGHFRESFGLEAMTSVSHLPFIERSTASNAFTPGRSRGVEWSELGASSLFQLGAFRRADGNVFPDELEEETAVTARALWQRGRDPLGGLELVQAGASVSVRNPGSGSLRFDARPGSRLFNRFVDTGEVDADGAITMGLEALVQWDQSTLVAEAFGAEVRGVSVGTGESRTGFLSGAHIGYSTFLSRGHAARWHRRRGGLRSPGVDDILSAGSSSKGALEAVARLSWVDLDGGPIRGGQAADLEVGLNWHLQPATRVMLHWLGTRVTSPGGELAFGSAILGRIQVQL